MAPFDMSFNQVPHTTETVLVTGGCGFIGSHTSKELLNRGYRVVVVDEMNDYYDVRIKERNLRELRNWVPEEDRFVFYKGDIGDEHFMRHIFEHEKPLYVCHLAARAGVRASLEDPRVYAHSNVVGTTIILDLARRTGVRSVAMASSSSVYGERKEDDNGAEDELADDGEPIHAFRETDAVVRPASPYAATKAACELLAYTFHALYQLPVACLRFFTVYGPGGRPDMAPLKFVDLISRGKQIDRYGDGSAVRDFTYVTDIVDGTLRSMFQPQGFQIYNLGGGNPVTLAYFIQLVEDGLGTKANIRELPPQPGDVSRTHASTTKARKLLGFQARVRIEDGVLKTIQWYRDFQEELHAARRISESSPSTPLNKRDNFIEYEGTVPEPAFAAKLLVCTRMHGQDNVNDTQINQLAKMIQVTLEVEDAAVAIAVEWTPTRMCLYAKLQHFLKTEFPRSKHRIHVIPVANWGITTALNAGLHEAARLGVKWIAFQSMELSADADALCFLRSNVDDNTLVAGAALPGHRFEDGEHSLDGTNCPWNTFAVWAVDKLAMTGFVAIGNGSVQGSQAGMEEVSTITVIQQLRTSAGKEDAQAKLLRVPGIEWKTEWKDETRQEMHARKMITKQERAAEHLKLLELKSAIVSHRA
eukprot:EG_transcript_3583